jgi:glycosyltransferase involved in cell wall biosynthesis
VDRREEPSGYRVLHLNTEKGLRGGEIQTLGLISHLRAAGVGCQLLAWHGGPLEARARALNLPVLPWRPRGEFDLRAVLLIRRQIRETSATIVHAHTAHALTLGLLARVGMVGVRLVASRRVSFPLRSRLSRLKYAKADAVVAVSGEIREGLVAQGLAPDRVTVIHSGVDLSRFGMLPAREEARASFGIPPGRKVVGVVGALAMHKGHAVLLNALARLKGLSGGVQLVAAGEGPLLDVLSEQAAALGLEVLWLGYLPEPARLYPALDCLVLPSLSGEGSPGVVKEAAAAGVPVVATDVGGAGEILRSGREALLVRPGDVDGLADSVLAVLEDRENSHRLAMAARERVKDFSMEQMAESHVTLYNRLLASG